MKSISEPNGPALAKSPTGIRGLDEITFGGIPSGRPTLVCGRAGCGKTLFAVEFLVHGAIDYNESGVFVAFEENEEDLTKNVASLGYDLAELCRRKKLTIDYIRIERSEIEETGDYDLEGLFVRLGHAIESIGAKRVVLDTIEAIFSGFQNISILRAELRRLFRWLKDKGVTAVITAEQGDGALTRHGLEEYVSDCVILLDHRVRDQISTRRLRVVKYRGSSHGTNEYPFLIDERGISVLPITSLGLEHKASSERISTGIDSLDQMLGGKGFYRGTSILISGTAGTGKTSIAAHFVDAACRRGERCVYFSSEESPAQLTRNLRSIGLDLEPWMKKGLLHFDATRPNFHGLEMHLLRIHKLIEQIKPNVAVFDPLSGYLTLGDSLEVKSMLTRLLDYLKGRQITSIFNSLVEGGHSELESELGVSSLMDSWMLLRNMEHNGERNRGLYILKARGIAHSNQIREFIFTDHGVALKDVYVGTEGVLTGSARAAQEAREKAAAQLRRETTERKKRQLERKRRALDAQIVALRTQFETEAEELQKEIALETTREQVLETDRVQMAQLRSGNGGSKPRRERNGKGV
ncbi:MAG TPA: circadian clock protein KaiC [Candidatus Limnocylindrales bacterium]|nr:circadian clock protein KaiC [Candidatus Limnocylindrales bacterium]